MGIASLSRHKSRGRKRRAPSPLFTKNLKFTMKFFKLEKIFEIDCEFYVKYPVCAALSPDSGSATAQSRGSLVIVAVRHQSFVDWGFQLLPRFNHFKA
jgi:hypothetical protein